MYSKDRLLILDADGTTIDAFAAIERTFAIHDMDIGDLERFQKRRHLFKYLGGLKELPGNLKHQIGRKKRAKLIDTLTQIYRDEAQLYDQIGPWINRLIAQEGLRVGLVTRNITVKPRETLRFLLRRHDVDVDLLDFIVQPTLKQNKTAAFRWAREHFLINPARCYACGDEKKDFVAAVTSGMHPFMVSYGFEDFERLTQKIGVPPELISRSPTDFRTKVCHALDLDTPPAPVHESTREQPQVSIKSLALAPARDRKGPAPTAMPQPKITGRAGALHAGSGYSSAHAEVDFRSRVVQMRPAGDDG